MALLLLPLLLPPAAADATAAGGDFPLVEECCAAVARGEPSRWRFGARLARERGWRGRPGCLPCCAVEARASDKDFSAWVFLFLLLLVLVAVLSARFGFRKKRH